jgi:hypothetical protein
MLFEKCKDILLREYELVQKAASAQHLTADAVKNREWTDFEGRLSEMGGLEREIAALETEREQLFAEFAAGRESSSASDASASGDDKSRFYALTAALPAGQRNELTAMYRALKLEALRLRMANEALASYLAGARAALAGFFEAAFPERGGRIYTRRGTPLSHDMRSMVLNRTF